MTHPFTTHSTLLSLTLALSLSATFAPSVSFADNKDDDFTQIMTDAIAHYKAGGTDPKEYSKAIELFTRAKQINNIPDVTYNIARAYHQMGDCENALATYREYALTSAENSANVTKYIQELDECKYPVNIQCTPNARVVIDKDKANPVECPVQVKLKKGDHSLVFTASNYKTETRNIQVNKSKLDVMQTVSVDLKPLHGESASAEPAQSEARDSETQSPTETTTDKSGQVIASPINECECDRMACSETSAAGKPGVLFWAGVGTAGGGAVLSLAGTILLATSHKSSSISFNGSDIETYERSKGALAGGGVLAGIGVAATLTGLGLIIYERLAGANNDDETAFHMAPGISVTPNSASASLRMTF